MKANLKLSEQIAILATLEPSAQAVGTAVTTYVPVANFHRLAALVDIGAVGTAGTVTVALMQATAAAGTGAKAITNPITGVAVATTAAVSTAASQVLLDVLTDWVDSNNSYAYVGLQITVATNAVYTQGSLIGHAPRMGAANLFNQAGVVQVI